jgi:glycosyltransferase involved in cell wall biosynthesis
MLTVCIPAFNYNIRSLMSELLFQMQTIESKSEIIVIDDGSDEAIQNFIQGIKK